MPSYFIGELFETRLFDLIKPLLDGKKSGMLSIKGRDSAEIHLEGGQVIHAKTSHSKGEEALLATMEWSVGRVSFDWEITTSERTVDIPPDDLLRKLSIREEEWRKIREAVPSPGTFFRIALQGDPGDRNIQGDQWKVLALCNGTKRVSDISDTLSWDLFKTSKTIYQMVQDGLLERVGEVVEEQRPVQKKLVNGNFFPMVENELKKLMGPIAPIIIEDAIADLGESKDSFPQDLIEKLLESITGEIADNARKVEFRKTIQAALTLESRSKP